LRRAQANFDNTPQLPRKLEIIEKLGGLLVPSSPVLISIRSRDERIAAVRRHRAFENLIVKFGGKIAHMLVCLLHAPAPRYAILNGLAIKCNRIIFLVRMT
jgi:hypothetical protein